MAARDSSDTTRERAFVPVLVYVGTVVSIISSLGAPLIPSIARDLDASLEQRQWSLTATLLVGAVATPVVGRLGDGRHRRTVTLACLAIVAVGGASRRSAGSLPVLVAGRAMQGVGLALMPLTDGRGARPPVRPRARRASSRCCPSSPPSASASATRSPASSPRTRAWRPPSGPGPP